MLKDLNPNRKLLNSLVFEVKSLSKDSISSNETTFGFIENLRSRFEKLVNENLENIESRSRYLKSILIISQKLDIISGKIRSLSCQSTRRFMAEEDDSSLHSAVEEQKSVLDQMRIYEQEVDELKFDAKSLGTDDHLQMPTVIYERLNCVQETIRHNISEELERRSSLLEIRQLNDLKENKIQIIDQNIKILEKIILDKSSAKIDEESLTSFFDSNLNDSLDESDDENKLDYYFKKISRCKDIIARNVLIIEDLNYKKIGHTDPIDDRLEKLSFLMNHYDYQINQIVDLYEKTLAKQTNMEKQLENFKTELADVLKYFDDYSQNENEIANNNDPKTALDFLSIQNEKILSDLRKIDSLKIAVNSFISQKNEDSDTTKFNGEKNLPSLLTSFKNIIEAENLFKENEFCMKINEFLSDLNLVEDNYRNKSSEIRFKMNHHSISTKQKKLDYLTNTLDIQMDTLKGLSKEKENFIDLLDEEFDDLRKESENILLEKMSLDDTQSTPNQSNKDLILLQETTTRQIVRTIENVIKDDHRYEVYKVLPINSNEENHFEETTTDYMIQSDEKMINHYEESILIEPETDIIKIEREKLEFERAELEKSIIERYRHEQEIIERENLLKKEREKLDLEKSQLELSRIELENKEKLERERNESIRLERQKLELERMEIERQEQEKIRTIENMIKLERQNLERDKFLLEQSKIEKLEAERLERDRLEQESREVKRILKLEIEKLEAEKRELEKQRLEKEKEQKELERIRQERLEINQSIELERSRIEHERSELERKARIEQSEREKIEAERKELERKAIEKERIEIEKRRHEIQALENERLELERLAKIERDRIERKRLEQENLEREKLEIEKKRTEAERLEQERIELEKKAQIERERFEKEKIDLENEKLEIEKRRLEREKLERERLELEQIYHLEKERLEREKIELERQRCEKELLEKERNELDRKRNERQKLENERKLLESQYKAEKERIEQERLSLENLEKERSELKKLEMERIKMIENERKEKLRQERLKIEKIRSEREEKERIDRERREREQTEALTILELKRKEREELEKSVKLERERQAEIERIENEIRREKMEKLEQERLRNQEKFKLELHLKEICEQLNSLKSKILDLKIDKNSVEQIQQFEIELNNLDDQVLDLYNKSISLENRIIDPEKNDYYLFDTLDHAALTQFELLRSFLSYLKTQIEHKKNEILRKSDLKIRIANLKENLDRYILLAEKIVASSQDNQGHFCIENQSDLEKRIESMETIESSIDQCCKEINELSRQLKNDDFNKEFTKNKVIIEENIVQPLLMNLSNFKHFLNQWKIFDDRFNSFIDYLYRKCNFELLVEMMERESILFDLNSEFSDLESDLEKMSFYRTELVKKLSETDDLLMLGTNLFDMNQNPPVICPNSSKIFFEKRQLINDVSKFLDEKCSMLRFAIKEKKRFEIIRSEFSQLKVEVENLMCYENNSDLNFHKQIYEKIIDLKKRLRNLIEEKEREDEVENCDNLSLESKFQILKKKINPSLKLDVENSINYLMDTIQFLEVFFNNNISKKPSIEIEIVEKDKNRKRIDK